MGRITVFTTSEDLNSKQLLKELDKRQLPYSEVDLLAYPSKLDDLKALVDSPSVPHAFFNTRYVGGLDQCIKELKRWDQSNRFKTPREKYEAEIASGFDPSSKLLSLPSEGDEVIIPPAKAHKAKKLLKMPDGAELFIREVTESLKGILPFDTCTYQNAVYRNSFSGQAVVTALSAQYQIPINPAERFAAQLCKEGIIRHVNSVDFPPRTESSFKYTSHDIYRLQCDSKPTVLNSYLTWPLDADPTVDCLKVVDNLSKLLSVMELSSLDPVDGLLNAQHAFGLKKFCKFEEAACELQNISREAFSLLDENELTAFALNVYFVMLRYAYLKVGVPPTEEDRQHFMRTISFDMAGEYYTLQEWVDIITSRSKLEIQQDNGEGHLARSSASEASDKDSVSKDSMSESTTSDNGKVKNDLRLYFALFVGPYGGSRWSLPFSQYQPTKLDQQLDITARVFCQEDRNVQIHHGEQRIDVLSSIFKTYRSEFSHRDNGILKLILPFLGGKKRLHATAMLAEGGNVKVTYIKPELGGHTVSGPWYRKKSENSKKSSTNKMKGFQVIKIHQPPTVPSPAKERRRLQVNAQATAGTPTMD